MAVTAAFYSWSSPGETEAGRSLSLVIPAWNEAETICQAIHEAESALAEVVDEHEIIVVDDGSTDATAELVRAETELNPRLRLIMHPVNRGYGAALRTGFLAARHDLVAFTDADCQFDLTELEGVLPLLGRSDMACGYRIDRKDCARRRFQSWGYNTLVRWLLGNPLRDVDCAFKVCHRAALLSILPACDNFFVNTEMLCKATWRGMRIVEVGVTHRPRAGGESKVSWRAIPRTLATLLPFWWSRVVRKEGEPYTSTLADCPSRCW